MELGEGSSTGSDNLLELWANAMRSVADAVTLTVYQENYCESYDGSMMDEIHHDDGTIHEEGQTHDSTMVESEEGDYVSGDMNYDDTMSEICTARDLLVLELVQMTTHSRTGVLPRKLK